VKHFVIAGGSHGIGIEIVKQLLDQGHKVTCVSRTEPELQHSQLHFIAHDFLSGQEIPEITGAVDGVAYCPGSINLKMFRSLKPEEFLQDFELNVMGAVRLLQKLQIGLKAVPGSSVVLFSTVAVQQGMAFHSSIAAAKGAIEGLTRSLAAEWAPAIRVNAIAPSLVETPLSAKLLSSPEKAEASAKRHPLARVGKPEDIASMAVFLLGEQSGWITGQVMGVDGGMSVLR
jgi:NAD(P)-dependent dehydrogenase (short-subunit alcohol dehydrogenase family)